MEPIYENEDGKLKITTPMVRLIPYEELLAEKAAIESEEASLDVQHAANKATLAARLSKVVTRLRKADELGVQAPEPEPEEAPVEEPVETHEEPETSE